MISVRRQRLLLCAVVQRDGMTAQDAEILGRLRLHIDGLLPRQEMKEYIDSIGTLIHPVLYSVFLADREFEKEHIAAANWSLRAKEALDCFLESLYGTLPPLPPVPKTEDAVAMATPCYWELVDDAMDPVRISILADALEDAGAVEAVEHLRTGIHYRGCWVLDSLLGKPLDAPEKIRRPRMPTEIWY